MTASIRADWMLHMTTEQHQDYLDGAALRRLREAMGADCPIIIRPNDHLEHIGPSVQVGGLLQGECQMATSAYGPTIAAAADECRESLG